MELRPQKSRSGVEIPIAKPCSPRESHHDPMRRVPHFCVHNNHTTNTDDQRLYPPRIPAVNLGGICGYNNYDVECSSLPHSRRLAPQYRTLAEAAPTLSPTSATGTTDGKYGGSGESDAYDGWSGTGYAGIGRLCWRHVSCDSWDTRSSPGRGAGLRLCRRQALTLDT